MPCSTYSHLLAVPAALLLVSYRKDISARRLFCKSNRRGLSLILLRLHLGLHNA